jgi:hypothetical protein
MIEYYKQSLTSLFKQVHVLRGDPYGKRENCLEIQEGLIRRITYVEARSRKLKIVIKDLQKRLALRQNVRLSKAEAQTIKDKISYYQNKVDEYQLLLIIFRQIGDALAFIYFDKWDIKPLAFKQSPGFVSQKKGLKQEKANLRRIFALGRVALMNDLTNCLRYGDISVPKDGKIIIFEVKSSNRTNSRTQRQMDKIRIICDYLSKDETGHLYEMDGDFHRIPLHSHEIHHREKLNSIISTALKNGVGYEEVEEGLHYLVSTGAIPNNLDSPKDECLGPGIAFLINEIKYNKTGYYPFTLSILNSEALYQFYQDNLLITILVDFGIIKRKLGSRGIEMELLSDENWFFKIRNIEDSKGGKGYCMVARQFFSRLLCEFLSLDWFLEEIIYKLRKFQAEPESIEEL